ncbi:hypothetical protein LSAT2_020035, partial [Lamellibrachia satsuma]
MKNLLCPSCECSTLGICAVSRRLRLVCRLEMFCSMCDVVVNKVSTSNRLGKEKASNVTFVVTRLAVAATMDMGVGHGTYSMHVKAIANMVVVTQMTSDTA